MKTFITESELKNRVEKLKAYTDIIKEGQNENYGAANHDNFESVLGRIANEEDYNSLYDLLSDRGSVGDYLQRQIEDITAETGLHPKDDFERIEEMLMAHIQREFGHSEALDRNNEPESSGIHKHNEFNIGESVGFCSDDSLVRILAITNRVIK